MVEIIPKPIEEVPGWQKILFYFSILLLLGVIVSYFVLVFLEKKSQVTLQNLEETLAKTKAQEIISLEKEIFGHQKKIRDFSPLFEQHILTSKFFEFLEKKSHPRIFFSQVNLNSGVSKVVLSGQADSFLTLGQQLLIFEAETLIKGLSLSQVSISKEGKIEFVLDLSLSPKIFRY
ncbi:MAG: hypothetical protein ACE5J0_02940 [Candidatus Paceibacterales bacterium]